MVEKTRHTIDLSRFKEFSELKRGVKEEVKREIGNFVKESILDRVGDGKSPVSGGAWKRSLSPEYKKQKAKKSSVTFANLELKGDMLDSLDFRPKKDAVEVGIYGDTLQDKKAYNHNTGDTLPTRRFIPRPGEKFKRDIESEIRGIVKQYYSDESNRKDKKQSLLGAAAAAAAAARGNNGEGTDQS